ncbi:MAG: transposase [Candidatus Bathyarchaeia archaeon]
MKINRSSKLSLKFATANKHQELAKVLDEYARVVNGFIALFWEDCPKKGVLLKPIVDSVSSWLSARLRKVAAREAIDMIQTAKKRHGKKAVRPLHRGKRMCVSSTVAELQPARKTEEFDAWLHLHSIGAGIILNFPIKYHKHFNELQARGQRLESYIITKDSVQCCFEIETGPKKPVKTAIGVDTGIKALASLSTGEQLGTDVENHIERIKRCKQGSKGQQRARRSLRQRIDEVARDVAKMANLIVVEKLKGICNKTKVKRRLTKNMRRSLGSWNVRYWLSRLQARTEDNRVVFRSVPAFYTSTECPSCGHTERSNRTGELFCCRKCGHADNADVNAAKNILSRLLFGPYGAEFKLCLAGVTNVN